MNIFAFKLILTPTLVLLASLAGRRWGAAISGWLNGLPLSSAPIMLFMALEYGTAFASTAASSVLLGLVSMAAFCLTYSRFALRFNWLPALCAGWTAFFVTTFFLQRITVSVIPAFFGVLIVLSATYALLPAVKNNCPVKSAQPSWDVPLRMIIAAVFVLVLTGLAGILGPHLSGLLVPFPLFANILAVFTHRFQGSQAVVRLLRGVVMGAFSFAAFFLVIAVLIDRSGIAAAFIYAAAAARSSHSVSLLLLKRNLI